MKVMKFGGGCLKNGGDFLKVAAIVAARKDSPVIVVSAVHGVTDLLEAGIHEAMKSEQSLLNLIEFLRKKHRNIIDETITADGLRLSVSAEIEERLGRVERLLFAVACTKEVTDSVRAQILSYGERMSALLLAAVLQDRKIEAVALAADEIGIMTDECYESATPILEEVRKNLARTVLPLVDRGVVPVITGYFGCSPDGKVTTFGRNGSDYSASVIASATDASSLEIWKDVDGFMTADPKIVRGSRRIDRLSYYEAAELSYLGAQILHPRTVEPLMASGIPLYIKNLSKPEDPGTEILNGGYEREDVVKSVSCNRKISVLRIHGPGVGFKSGIIAEIGKRLSRAGINIFSILTSQTCINLFLDKKDCRKGYESIEKMQGGVIEKVRLEEDIALISVVGEGLQKRKGVAARVFAAVAEEDVNVEMISMGASEVAYYFIVKDKDAEKTMSAVHREFF